jgi:hypothetical protein
MTLHPEVKKRIAIEKAVVRAFVKSALNEGCEISVYDGMDYPLKRSTDEAAIMKAIMSTDEDHLFVWKGGVKIGFVSLVYGNDGWDVICDYSVNLEPLMADCRAVSDKHEGRAA